MSILNMRIIDLEVIRLMCSFVKQYLFEQLI